MQMWICGKNADVDGYKTVIRTLDFTLRLTYISSKLRGCVAEHVAKNAA